MGTGKIISWQPTLIPNQHYPNRLFQVRIKKTLVLHSFPDLKYNKSKLLHKVHYHLCKNLTSTENRIKGIHCWYEVEAVSLLPVPVSFEALAADEPSMSNFCIQKNTKKAVKYIRRKLDRSRTYTAFIQKVGK